MTKQQTITTTVILLIIASLAGGALIYTSQQSTISPQTSPSVSFKPLASPPSSTSSADLNDQLQSTQPMEFVDGIYQTTGSYTSPGGRESVQVSLTIEDDVVANSNVVSLANHSTSKQYQAQFVADYKQYVHGKKLTDIKVSRVSGSSLTSNGFNQALAAIKSQARRAQ